MLDGDQGKTCHMKGKCTRKVAGMSSETWQCNGCKDVCCQDSGLGKGVSGVAGKILPST